MPPHPPTSSSSPHLLRPAMPPLHSLCLSRNPILPARVPGNLSAKPTKQLLQTLPLEASSLPLQFREKILCLEIMGVDSGKALAVNPSLHTASLDSIHSVISFLQSKGIHQKDLGRILGMCPKIITSDVRTQLLPVFTFLSQDLKVPESNFRRTINKCPRLLASSVEDQLKPTLFYLQRLGLRDISTLAYQDSVLLVSSVEKTLIPKLDFLTSVGYTRDEAVGMVLRCPGLFTYSVERNFKPKFGYYVGEMGGSLEELKGFPQYFGFSLEKRIQPRHREMTERGAKLPLALMLKSSDEEFRELMKKGG
ncbi:transcription termination factor MTEF1, chloroplastic [Aristolochia californica]|uniref:transcription termination factor MTEF1, chloroplastic n=1 Tax=Aristolochia californica TaxID=171875 RepID=UPI0035D6AF07